MNIFKILANGGGSINETNVSAFLGYLLDPKEDHGLGYEFISRFLNDAVEEGFEFDMYDYEVFYEQSFGVKGSKKERVDIVLVCYSIDRGNKQRFTLKEFFNDPKDLKNIFLIENKINVSSLKEGQIVRQFNNASQELDEKDKLNSIYLTPKHESFDEEFFKANLKNSTQVYWNQEEDSVRLILTELLEDEVKGQIEPLSEYTRHTIKAFCQFIDNNFKSQKEVRKVRKNDGSYTQKYIELNISSGIEEKLRKLRTNLLRIDNSLSISEPILNPPREPELLVYYNGIAISLYAGFKSRDIIMLIYKVHESRKKLDELAENLDLDVKKKNYGDSAYFKEEWMSKKLPIHDYNEIYKAIQNAFRSIDQAIS